jgi:peptide-methionine (R)-S-oxide reductase
MNDQNNSSNFEDLKNQPEEYWRTKLSPAQYRVLREQATETPFTGELNYQSGDGMYHCAGCGQPLFSSNAKHDAGTGWPSFWNAVDRDAVSFHLDDSHGMIRTEVRCSRCGGHLGHVFGGHPKDIDPESGEAKQEYCINSCALEFKEK